MVFTNCSKRMKIILGYNLVLYFPKSEIDNVKIITFCTQKMISMDGNIIILKIQVVKINNNLLSCMRSPVLWFLFILFVFYYSTIVHRNWFVKSYIWNFPNSGSKKVALQNARAKCGFLTRSKKFTHKISTLNNTQEKQNTKF